MGEPQSLVQHAREVMSLVGEFPRLPTQFDKPVIYSWLRCAKEHHLRPDGPMHTAVVENVQLRERQQRIEDLVLIARAEMDSLYEQISGSGYALLLTDASGVILSEKVDPTLRDSFRKAGLIAGANWSEQHEGTNGIGTCITERRPITIHRNDHFRARHIGLSCSAAPIRDTGGELMAVLDASCVGSDDSKASRMHTVALLSMSARLIEKCLFLRRFRNKRVIRFHSRPEFVNLLHDGALAVDADGRITAADDTAVALLSVDCRSDLIGRPVNEIFDVSNRELESGMVMPRQPILPVRDMTHGRRYYMSLHAPQLEQRSARINISGKVLAIEPSRGESRVHSLEELAGQDPTMLRNARCAQRIAASKVSVLIQGPTGSGKEAFARALHLASDRANQPFVAVNCAAIPESLIESELFGYRAGAFTGARREGMRGLIAQSSGGTLFLDEIGDMPLTLQTRLLRVLEEQEVTPLGGEAPVKVNLRIVSASHRPLRDMIARGEFREDLFYRLNGITLSLPALRQREDLETLIHRILAEEAEPGRPAGIEAEAFRRLAQHDWPGNVRELRNVIRTALAIAEAGVIRVADLPAELQSRAMSSPMELLSKVPVLSSTTINTGAEAENPLMVAEREALLRAIAANAWNMTNTARQLAISRNTLYRKLKAHGIAAETLRSEGLARR
ncbi:Transcriptional regulator of acetoin/glycerol metabolism [Solimonas aquatica]|uniref:Transcriptional regulator of acetoin/glycerol metabolism n=1 Tax=Solimonas aquatica TaxID=489703 RepID=A0A1H8ZQS0_9GAMM|nr:sigma-54-dependent Fis family transcriptional regulator [Solimonas aquatica]SEP66563.1 Transcriptional regulator of acetoin/glycerol metabolism [Solimonas aquatica]